MENTMSRPAFGWNVEPSAKTKSAVQRSVTALLNELAPQRVLKRADESQGPIAQYRAPGGCVLQAETCAVSVSWFGDATEESALGELYIRVWEGKVTRRGGHQRPKNAVMVTELVLRPIESPLDNCCWEAADGSQYDTAKLAAKCSALLWAQTGAPNQDVMPDFGVVSVAPETTAKWFI